VVTGGVTRFQSVKNGLENIPENALVAIHDGVRPLVSTRMIATSFALARIHGSAVASLPLKESLRLITEGEPAPLESTAVDRSLYRIIQTPQTFQAGVIRKAYAVGEDETLTDDASVAERSGSKICLFEGDPVNIKITHPEDLIMAEALLSRQSGL
jgi:2-C-methyl-D-erythritol 4-phosphate cytidylyltransferase